jgi:hypothetical protein
MGENAGVKMRMDFSDVGHCQRRANSLLGGKIFIPTGCLGGVYKQSLL